MGKHHLSRKAFFYSILAAIGLIATAPSAMAQNWPDRPIRIVVPSAPSTPPDLVSRIIAAELQKNEGWTVVIENKPGGVQTIAARDVATAPADGYSVFAPSMVIAAAGALMPASQIDMQRDFAPIIKASISYNLLVLNVVIKEQ